MKHTIVPGFLNSTDPVTLIGGGEISAKDLEEVLTFAPKLVAADGGAAFALSQNVVPDAVYGDFDSLDDKARSQIPQDRIHHIAEQDSTDFDKALRHVNAPLVVGVGFLGKRMDHQMAAKTVLVRYSDRRCILVGSDDIVFLAPPSINLNISAGTRVSLFPMGAVEGWSDGLQWPIQGIGFAPDGRIGTSNQATGPVQLEFTAPKMLVILPRPALEQAITDLQRAPARWSVPSK